MTMAVDSVELPPCDEDIRENGVTMAVIPPGGMTAHEIEEVVVAFRRLTGLRIDWHYVAGRAVVKWLR